MDRSQTFDTLTALVHSLEHHAVVARDVPGDVARVAADATVRRLRNEPLDRRTRARAGAYFEAVVRKRLVKARAHGPAAARLVIAAVVADLTSAGRDPQTVWHELERGWAGKVPGSVLEEYRARLCA